MVTETSNHSAWPKAAANRLPSLLLKGDWDPHLIQGAPQKLHPKRRPRSIQPFLHSADAWHTDRHHTVGSSLAIVCITHDMHRRGLVIIIFFTLQWKHQNWILCILEIKCGISQYQFQWHRLQLMSKLTGKMWYWIGSTIVNHFASTWRLVQTWSSKCKVPCRPCLMLSLVDCNGLLGLGEAKKLIG